MGFIKAFAGALGGTFSDQWKDFYVPKSNISGTVAITEAVPQGMNSERGTNTKGSKNIITNGSKIIVPEGMALLTFQDGALTGFIAEPGGFEYRSDDINSKSFFVDDEVFASITRPAWEKFKFGGQPGSQQLAYYVNLKEIPNNRFGTQSEIYWDDAYLGAQVGALTRGTYTLKIVDPISFVKNFAPTQYLQPNGPSFDFADLDNDAGVQLFNEVVSSLSQAFSLYTNDASKGNRISKIQADQIGFAQSLSNAVEEGFSWRKDRGLEIVKVAIVAIEYDEDTKKLLSDVKKADALSGSRGNSFMQQSFARGMESAGENGGGGSGIAFMGMGMDAAGNMMRATQQQQQAENIPSHQTPPPLPNQQMFHVILDGVQQGPIPISLIQQLIQSSKITPQTMVWCAGMPSWVAANSISELQLFFGAIPPPPPTI
jgi:membrane protease subunit (stomatin/prohibitin family)